jgi:Rrf2 family protein
MRITTKGRYGTRMILDIALHDQEGPVPLSDIAARQGISKKYLEQLILELKKAGIVATRRGARGGHVLARPAREISVGDIVRALELPEDLDLCGECGECNRAGHCMTRGIWAGASRVMGSYLDAITIESLILSTLPR